MIVLLAVSPAGAFPVNGRQNLEAKGRKRGQAFLVLTTITPCPEVSLT